jgi:hypothetical protein
MTKENIWLNDVIPAFTETGADPSQVAALLEHAEKLGDLCPYVIHFRQAVCNKLAKTPYANDNTTKVFLDMFEAGFTMGIIAGAVAQHTETQEEFKSASTKERVKMVLSGEVI